ncbi:hypothetical protein [Thiocapsa sp. N5-Cardenillas]|uniref:hypothetical protein n=1 Tax=Thiocapsa sp. N5-Cardenillas TaxID=3137397 RepID=UPI0035B30A9C
MRSINKNKVFTASAYDLIGLCREKAVFVAERPTSKYRMMNFPTVVCHELYLSWRVPQMFIRTREGVWWEFVHLDGVLVKYREPEPEDRHKWQEWLV